MFRKYEKTFRVLVPQINVKGKHYLSNDETKKLLGSNVCITEKMDGANTAIIRHKDYFKLQKRGSLVDYGEHYQFNFFKAWTQTNYDKLMQIPKDTVLYGELMICKHTVFYDMLPDYFLPFAWFDKNNNKYKHRDEMDELCNKIGLFSTPFICKTSGLNKDELFNLIPDVSNYGHEPAEGIVVWNYKNGMRGKVVREKFVKDMEESEHWMNKQITKNIVNSVCNCKNHGDK